MKHIKRYSLCFTILVLTILFSLPSIKANAAAKGKCGPNATWSLSDDGTLTISGKGAVYGYPWDYALDSIKSIVIKEGITSIWNIYDSNYFIGVNSIYYKGMVNLTSATIPSTLTDVTGGLFENSRLQKVTFTGKPKVIPASLFQNCKFLKSIKLPSSITTIEEYAFAGCTGLTSIQLPANLKRIETCGFNECISLKSINLPNKLKYIGYQAFGNCPLSNINFSGRTTTLPKTLTYLGDEAFNLSEVPITFEYQNGIYRILHFNNKKISFIKPIKTSYKSFIIPAKINLGESSYKVTAIEANAFKNNKKLKTLTINSTTITSIGKNAFKNMYNKAKIYVPKKKASAYKKLMNAATGYVKTMTISSK